jgi:hypothetical protein
MKRFLPWILRLLALTLPLCGCVPQTRYEEARSATRIEQEAHRRTQATLVEIGRKLDQTQVELGQREQRLEKMEQDLAEAKLNADVAGTERQNALDLVETLRADLGRTGDHLRVFADEKSKLAGALDAAKARAEKLASCEQEASENAAVIRDLSVLLAEPIATGAVELQIVEGRPVLRFPSNEIGAEAIQPTGKKVLAAVAKVTQLHPETRVRIGESGAANGAEPGAARLKRISDQLAAQGLKAERVELRPGAPAKPDAPKGESTLEISVYADAKAAPAATE